MVDLCDNVKEVVIMSRKFFFFIIIFLIVVLSKNNVLALTIENQYVVHNLVVKH